MNKALLAPANAVLHIEHCPNAEVLSMKTAMIALPIISTAFRFKLALISVPRIQARQQEPL